MWRRKSRADRRREPRKPVHWVGHYVAEGRSAGAWYPCAVRNISAGGAGLMLCGGVAVKVGEALLIELERIGPTPVSVRIRGTARSLGAPNAEGTMDIGVRLHFDAPHERRIARTLFAG